MQGVVAYMTKNFEFQKNQSNGSMSKKNVQIVLMNYGLKMLSGFPPQRKMKIFIRLNMGKKDKKKGKKR